MYFIGYRADLGRRGPINPDGTGGLTQLREGTRYVCPEGADAVHVGAVTGSRTVRPGDTVEVTEAGSPGSEPWWLLNGAPGPRGFR